MLALVYATGVAAVAAERYDNLWALLDARLGNENSDVREERPLVVAAGSGLNSLSGYFKRLPGLDRRRTPLSDHMFELLRTDVEDLLLLGRDFERAFDRLEVIVALEQEHRLNGGRTAMGRFAWKWEASPLASFLAEAKAGGKEWRPLRAGFFGGSPERLQAIAEQLKVAVSRSAW